MTERRIRIVSLAIGVLVWLVLGVGYCLIFDAFGMKPIRGLVGAVAAVAFGVIAGIVYERLCDWLSRNNPHT